MKGLIRNSFYSMENNIKLSLVLSLVLVLTALFLKKQENISLINMLISVQIFVFIANIGTSLHADEVSKWNKFQRTLPVSKASVIFARYLSFSSLILMGLVCSMLTGILALSRIPSLHVQDLLWGYGYGLTLSILVACFMYPVMLQFGTEKNELILILCAFITISLMLLIAFLLSPLTGGMKLHAPLVVIVSMLMAVLLLIVSYFVSLKIYSEKE